MKKVRASSLLFTAIVVGTSGCGDRRESTDRADLADAAAWDSSDDAAVLTDAENELSTDGAVGDQSRCDPPCTIGQGCCTDLLGHFPACANGPTCP
jgi:hypothetical protein